jgi:large subunit ribosomal protein L23
MNKLIIKRPFITEKSLSDAQKGIYTFEVDKKAKKPAIKAAVEEMFKVHVTALTTVILKGKTHRAGRKRMPSAKPDIKKARTTLTAGEKIDLFEVGETKK